MIGAISQATRNAPAMHPTAPRSLGPLDRLITRFDHALRTLVAEPAGSGRVSPAREVDDGQLSTAERRFAGALMRVDHAGEVAAQALYYGHATTARRDAVREAMDRAAREEGDHLAWCRERLRELDARRSYLDPVWYAGSFAIGALTGLLGDRWSLGFVAETERQVVDHLSEHLRRLPPGDHRGRAILNEMRADEGRHAITAARESGVEIPRAVAGLMRRVAKIMTRGAYWI